MNNLLRTLTESHVKSSIGEADLKLLLTAVKDGRRQSYDTKLSDPFYDSLEGLLLDLRTVSQDNRDAEAFLKPVSKTEVPDYYDVISHPMDLQTMLKKVKSKQYKSKLEFQDDLDLIWSNCFTYNATENHPLRQCAQRLKGKADILLKNITDRKDRADPPIPADLSSLRSSNGSTASSKVKVNGIMTNGYSRSRDRTLSPGKSALRHSIPSAAATKTSTRYRHDAPFSETAALDRTREGMELFMVLDREVDQWMASSSSSVAYARAPSWGSDLGQEGEDEKTAALIEKLQELVTTDDDESDGEEGQSVQTDSSTTIVDGEVGEKRKVNGFLDHRPRKRPRTQPRSSSSEKNILDLWWNALQSAPLVGNGVSSFRYPTSTSLDLPPLPSSSTSSHPIPGPSRSHQPRTAPSYPSICTPIPNPKKPKKRKKKEPTAPPDSLLRYMNDNIKTMKRVRRTHARFAALNLGNNSASNEEGAPGAAGAAGMGIGIGGSGSGGGGPGALVEEPAEVEGEEVVEAIDERPWRGVKGKSGIDMGEENALDAVHWAGRKILEHSGFQGSSKAALDVLAGVTTEYLFNVGRTIRFLCDKYTNRMTAEEIILHTLFESGTTKIQDLERYIKDDVLRYGSRLGDVEKKLINAYSEATAIDAQDEDDIFGNEEDEEEEGELMMGGFADSLGDDFFGLRELGIAAELGLSSLSVPKRLLRRKRKADGDLASAAKKPSEPPPPYPPPPPLLPLSSDKLDNQIGLLRPFYQERFTTLAATMPPPPAYPLGGLLPVHMPPGHLSHSAADFKANPVVLPDDSPPLAHTKIGPLGQIIKANPAASSAKKKQVKVKEGPAPPPPGGGPGTVASFGSAPPGLPPPFVVPALVEDAGSSVPGLTPRGTMSVTPTADPSASPESPKKKKTGSTGPGPSRKKKVPDGFAPVVIASA